MVLQSHRGHRNKSTSLFDNKQTASTKIDRTPNALPYDTKESARSYKI